MATSRKKLMESLASQEVARVTGARVEKRDTGAEQSVRDFDITFGDGTKGALEVTELTAPRMEDIMGALRKQGIDIKTDAVMRRWYLWLSQGEERFSGAELRDLRKNVVRFLVSLETQGITEFDSFPSRSSRRAVTQLLSRFPILFGGTSSPIQEQPRVQILPPAMTGMAGPEALIELVQAVAWLPDNRRKLDVEGVDERHLFVWVYPWLPAAAALDEPAPNVRMDLPPEASHVWVALNSKERRRLWRYNARHGWI